MLDHDARERREREERLRQRQLDAQFRSDVQAVMALVEGRRVVHAFLETMGVDRPAYRSEPHDMVIAAALQDGARWWVTAIRDHCPEREVQMRAEARKAEREAQSLAQLGENEEEA